MLSITKSRDYLSFNYPIGIIAPGNYIVEYNTPKTFNKIAKTVTASAYTGVNTNSLIGEQNSILNIINWVACPRNFASINASSFSFNTSGTLIFLPTNNIFRIVLNTTIATLIDAYLNVTIDF